VAVDSDGPADTTVTLALHPLPQLTPKVALLPRPHPQAVEAVPGLWLLLAASAGAWLQPIAAADDGRPAPAVPLPVPVACPPHVPALQRWLRHIAGREDAAAAALHVLTRPRMGRPPIVVAVGGRGAGKSTLLRWLVNAAVSANHAPHAAAAAAAVSTARPGVGQVDRWRGVAYLDCDVGQPEHGPPGAVTLTLLRRPLLSPPHARSHFAAARGLDGGVVMPGSGAGDDVVAPGPCVHFMRSAWVGSSSVKAAVDAAEAGMRDCFAAWEAGPARDGVPLVVNTHGWVRGVGWETTAALLRLMRPAAVLVVEGGVEHDRKLVHMGPAEEGEPVGDVAAGVDALGGAGGEPFAARGGGGSLEGMVRSALREISPAGGAEAAHIIAVPPWLPTVHSDAVLAPTAPLSGTGDVGNTQPGGGSADEAGADVDMAPAASEPADALPPLEAVESGTAVVTAPAEAAAAHGVAMADEGAAGGEVSFLSAGDAIVAPKPGGAAAAHDVPMADEGAAGGEVSFLSAGDAAPGCGEAAGGSGSDGAGIAVARSPSPDSKSTPAAGPWKAHKSAPALRALRWMAYMLGDAAREPPADATPEATRLWPLRRAVLHSVLADDRHAHAPCTDAASPAWAFLSAAPRVALRVSRLAGAAHADAPLVSPLPAALATSLEGCLVALLATRRAAPAGASAGVGSADVSPRLLGCGFVWEALPHLDALVVITPLPDACLDAVDAVVGWEGTPDLPSPLLFRDGGEDGWFAAPALLVEPAGAAARAGGSRTNLKRRRLGGV
jgi:hypothetical protein